MQTIAVRNIQRPPRDALDALGRFGCATVHEAQGRTGLMQNHMRPVYPGAHRCGSALTVMALPGDNWMLHAAAELIHPGDIVVVAMTAPNGDGMFGELLATSFRARGAVALVIESGCRDVATLREMDFPVWSRAVSAQGTVKATPGAINVPIVCGGVQINPGDALVCDDDGIVVVRRDDVAAVAEASRKREEQENRTRERLAAGELGLDIYDMREKLAKAGLVYVDELPAQ